MTDAPTQRISVVAQHQPKVTTMEHQLQPRGAFMILLAVLISQCFSLPVGTSFETEEWNRLKVACVNQTGSEEIMDTLQSTASEVQTCMSQIIDFNVLRSDVDKLSVGTRVAFFDKYCPLFNQTTGCLTSFNDQIRKCFNEDARKLIDTSLPQLVSMVELGCRDHGDIFFRNGELIPFSTFMLLELRKCAKVSTIDFLFFPNEIKCTDVVKEKDCVGKVLTTYGVPRLMEFYDLKYSVFPQHLQCVIATTENPNTV